MAASVSTRVVSWKEAADSHESVASEALVMPISSGRPSAGFLPSCTRRRLVSANTRWSDPLPGQEVRLAGLLDGDAAGHLPDDELDVLVVDRHALVAVHPLDLVHQVLLHGPDALDLEELLGVTGTLDQRVAGDDLVAVAHLEPTLTLDGVQVLLAVVADDGDVPDLAVLLVDAHHTGGAGQHGLVPGAAGLEQLHHTGKTAGDVAAGAGHTTGVEGPHGQLRAGLADGLGGDDADGLARLDGLAGGQRHAVAGRRDADARSRRSAATAPGPTVIVGIVAQRHHLVADRSRCPRAMVAGCRRRTA